MKPKHFEIELNCALCLSFTVILHVNFFFFFLQSNYNRISIHF